MSKLVFAYTPTSPFRPMYPPFVNAAKTADGGMRLMVRGEPSAKPIAVGPLGSIELSRDQALAFAEAIRRELG